jgi:SAM-dependent methyltransferase
MSPSPTMTDRDSGRRRTSLSVLVPAYNEEHLVRESLSRLRILDDCAELERVEVIVVDDGSHDGTAEVLRLFREEVEAAPGRLSWTFLQHPQNRGKGAAVRTALEHATGEISVVHDADLEYHPRDLPRLIRVFLDEEADAVFGSRFAGSEVRRVLLFRHQVGNKLLTFLCNLVTNLNLTDMETCYKAVRTSLLRSIPLVSSDFRFEPELTIKLAKRQARLFEVPISYSGRTYQEGKKINWRDGLVALWAIVRFALSDEIYVRDEHGSQILARLARAPRFNAWMADEVRPFCGQRVLEIGSGVGNLTEALVPRHRYVASDVNPLYLQTLNALAKDRPYLSARFCDVTDGQTMPHDQAPFDTVICLNVLEHLPRDGEALQNIRSVLDASGRALILVPQGPWNFGTLDEVLGHCRRYTRQELSRLAGEGGFEVAQVQEFNRFGTLAWWWNGKVLRRRSFGLLQVKLLNLLIPLLRRCDSWLPLPGLSLIAVLQPERDLH